MKEYRILFLVGADRPGIVHDVTSLLFDEGANIEDSRMATLGGCFSIMILLSFSSANRIRVENGVKNLEKMGFQVSLHDASDPAAAPRSSGLPLKVRITAMDHPGIVRSVVNMLREYDVNIDSLETRLHVAPLSGQSLFDLELAAVVPPGQSIARIKKGLEDLALEENMDLTFG